MTPGGLELIGLVRHGGLCAVLLPGLARFKELGAQDLAPSTGQRAHCDGVFRFSDVFVMLDAMSQYNLDHLYNVSSS